SASTSPSCSSGSRYRPTRRSIVVAAHGPPVRRPSTTRPSSRSGSPRQPLRGPGDRARLSSAEAVPPPPSGPRRRSAATTPAPAAAARSSNIATGAPRPEPERTGSSADVTEIAADPTPQASPVSFTARLHDRRYRLGTAVCLGLDPRPAAHPLTRPERLGATHVWEDAVLDAVAAYCVAVLDATHDLIAACKPQAAFFEALGPGGMDVLAQVTARARALGVPVILDATPGDIGTTA